MSKQDSQFKAGQSGNPSGRPRGARNKATVAAEALLDGEAETITRRYRSGNRRRCNSCLSRILPVKRERTIELDLPVLGGSQDSLRAIGTVLEAVGAGAITPSEGQAVTSLLEAHRRTFEVEELEHRIEALEAQQCAAR